MSKLQAQTPFEVRLDWKVVFGLTEPNVGGWPKVRAAQLSELLRVLPLIAVVHIFNGVSLVWLMWGTTMPLQAGAWLAVLMIVLFSAAASRRLARLRAPLDTEPAAMRRASLHGFLLGLVWSIPPLFFVDGANETQRAAIYLIAYAMMTSGTLTASTIPQVALLYVGGSAIGVSVMVARFGDPLLALLPPAYALGLVMCAFYNGRAFLSRKCAEMALEEKSEVVSLLLREFEENGADWLWQVDSARQLANVSSRFARAANRDPQALEGTPLLQLFAGASWETGELTDEVKDLFDRLQRRESFKDIVLPILVDGETRWWCLSATPRYSEAGVFEGFRGVGSDRTEQRRSVERIDQMARLDSLTGLLNRREITSALRDALARAFRDRSRCALLLIDLDRFKAVNDTLGHPIGDRLLKLVAERLRNHMGPTDIGGRLGGDEFVIVATDASDVERIDALGAALVAALGEPFHIDHHVIRIGGSVGTALGPRDGRTVETLLRHADVALYQAKNEGRGLHRRYEPRLMAGLERRRTVEAALREALDRGTLELVYAPAITLAGGSPASFEAQLSWTHPKIGTIAHEELLGVASEAQLATRLGEWLLRTASADAARWPGEARLSLDVGRELLLDGQFAATLLSALSHAGLSPGRLEINIPEALLADRYEDAAAGIERLRALGVRVALDGFGAGRAAMGLVRAAHFDIIKVSPEVIRATVQGDPERLAILRGTIAMAQSLGLSVMARGAHEPAEVETALSLGCLLVEGRAVGAPVAAEAVAEQLSEASARAAAA